MDTKTARSLGSINTPADFAQFLTSWAIRRPTSKVLDVGSGEGVFVFAAFRRLLELGARPSEAQKQLYGAEVSRSSYRQFIRLADSQEIRFPHLYNADFFEVDFPYVDAVIGNPPYVRRVYIRDVDRIRKRVFLKNPSIDERDLPRLADLYIYFLYHAITTLKPEGRLAVITADSWMNVGYGEGFKRYLLENFEIENLISLDRRVFLDAQVKPVLIQAIKKPATHSNRYVHFVRVRNGLPIATVEEELYKPVIGLLDITRLNVWRDELTVDQPWGIHFKASSLCEQIASHELMCPIGDLAQTRIGLQTLAKEFFVLTREQAKAAQIEADFLAPLAQSSRYINEPTIEPKRLPDHYVFYCSKRKSELRGTYALKYILQGESVEVEVRGKRSKVIGYHNKERIKQSGRHPWYDLKTSSERRGYAAILIPRLAYHTFTVVWNKARYVPGELFIEFIPRTEGDTEVYLAILTSSVSEIMLRANAQVYGGGTYNINPGQIKKVPILNASKLTHGQRESLKRAYTKYLRDESHDRSLVDSTVCRILGFGEAMQEELGQALEDLLVIASASKKPASTALQVV